MIKSPSKFTPLKDLYRIRQDHYLGAQGQEYSSEEVDRLIAQKEQRKAERVIADFDFEGPEKVAEAPKPQPLSWIDRINREFARSYEAQLYFVR